MIINNRYEFAFVHIPKCAGSAIKARIMEYDDLQGQFTARVDNHPQLGPLDYGHIPLYTLRTHFPAEFDRIAHYWSFVVLRDPSSRFLSAISQRLKMYRATYLHAASDEQLVSEIELVIRELRRHKGRLPPELIHFQPQTDYVLLDGERIINRVYSSEEVNQLFTELAARVGVDHFPDLPKNDPYVENKSFVFKSDTARVMVEAVRPAAISALRHLPESMKQRLRNALYTTPNDRFERIAKMSGLQSFVEEHYADDLALVANVNRQMPKTTE